MLKTNALSLISFLSLVFLFLQGTFLGENLPAQQREIPPALQPWKAWANWDNTTLNSPPTFDDAREKMPVWPGRLSIVAEPKKAEWKFSVTVFDEAWVSLPGSDEVWPQRIAENGESLPVVERNGRPAVRLLPGRHELVGEFTWNTMPQRLLLPPEIGLLTLTVNNEEVAAPNWDAGGNLWLTRQRTGEAEADSISLKVYRLLEDGIPTWLRTEIELTVSGKSREEELGWVLPEGWKLSTVESLLPVSVDERGRLKAQVRAGKWTLSFHAFRTNDERTIRFSEGAEPITDVELIGFKSAPEFRLAELTGLQAIDVTQTLFPQKWQGLPVFQWNTGEAITLEEKLRGMGMQRPAGLAVKRRLWLDEDGKGYTYHDVVSGSDQQIWRLDSAADQELGSVRVNGIGQLITASPVDNSPGVEIRERDLTLEAIGTIYNPKTIAATGWQADTDSLNVYISLPPGWRALAVFGADSVDGDWLTAWSLLDLFLLLIFGAAVFRLFGFWAGLVALLAFGLAYHEPGAPRFTWLFLMFPIALLRVVKNDTGRYWLNLWKFFAVGLLAIYLVPFLWLQLQSAIYPQLEPAGINFDDHQLFPAMIQSPDQVSEYDTNWTRQIEIAQNNTHDAYRPEAFQKLAIQSEGKFKSNLQFDPKARIQTGPAQPEWNWNQVYCHWNGPVAAEQRLRPILISLNQHRILTLARVALIVVLGSILFGTRRPRVARPKSGSAQAVSTASFFLLLIGGTHPAHSQEIPDAQTLQLLSQRLQETSDAFPNAAVIPSVSLKVEGNRVLMHSEIHTALEVAVPLPGRLPAWSPASVTVDGKSRELVCRHKGYLWTVLPKGVHHVVVESLLPDVADWEWTFLLKPKLVVIDAADWNVTGVQANGTPEQQIFFARKQQIVEGAAAYDRRDFNAIVVVNRHIEVGLIWQVRNVVARLSEKGKAVSIKVPLLPGENVLTSNINVEGGAVEVRFGADEESFSWVSELPRGKEVALKAPTTDQWIERWHLVTSPVWNVNRTGLAPIFEANEKNLIPVWSPWPGEEVTLKFSEPTAIVGATTTVQRVLYETDLGQRIQTARLNLELETSLGGDFPVVLDPAAEISSIKVNSEDIPARRVGESLIVPIRPGKQSIDINWRSDKALETVVATSPVTLPVLAANLANVTIEMDVPQSRWILWAQGPTMGPAVRFWVILAFAILAALILGGIKDSPLDRIQWVLLAIGLTQVHVIAGLFVVAWLFAIAWRQRLDPSQIRVWWFNMRQIFLVLMTVIALWILVVAVGKGLLGEPEMYITGNGSYRTHLEWFQPRVELEMAQPVIVSVSVWYYRLLMLLWSLWLAFAVLGWLTKGWKAFVSGGAWRRRTKLVKTESLPVANENSV
jgi:hypothetical protein